jgi:hypothetical protein
MNLSENAVEAVAELMGDATAILDAAGFSIDESVTGPQDFVDVVADLLDENDLDEDTEETLCLGIALIESFLSGFEIELSASELAEGELPEASMLSRLNKAARRAIEKESPLGSWKGAPGDKLAAKWAQHQDAKAKAKEDAIKAASPRTFRKDKQRMKRAARPVIAQQPADALQDKEHKAILKKYMDKMATMRSASAKLQALRTKKTTDAKRTRVPQSASEGVECPDAEVRAVLAVVESAGYEVPDDLPVPEFLEAVENLATQDAVVAEGLGTALAGAGMRMLRSKTARWAANKLARAGTKALVRKMDDVARPAAESAEDADALLATMIEVVTDNGYVFEGSEESFDPEKFLDIVVEIADTDETFAEDTSTWLKKSAEAIKGMAEAGQYGKLPPRGSAGLRKFVKKQTAKKARRDAKRAPEDAPTKRTSGWAD